MKNFAGLSFFSALPLAFFFSACQMPVNSDNRNLLPRIEVERSATETPRSAPAIEVGAPETGEGGYKIIRSDTFKIAVNAPGALEADLLCQPVTASDRQVKLKTLTAPDAAGRFETELETPEDFNGQVWARVRYPSGEVKQTARLQLVARRSETENQASAKANTNAAPNQPGEAADDDNESARSDKKTGGRIEKAALQPGNGNIRMTVNVPAFLLTLWQDDKEIKTFYVGVGRRDFPIPIGMRAAGEIILNPDWIPPDSEWVRASGVEPYERIPAGSADNPLGKIKIPLGDAYLLHEAQGASDIGRLVSHGCVRVLREDIFELTRMIVAAHNLPVSVREIEAARKNSKRKVIKLNGEIPVDINYDTIVVEGGALHIYPDVYEQKTNTVAELRAELEACKIDVSKLDDAALKKMLDSAGGERKFVIPLSAIRAGRAPEGGKVEPLTPFQAKKTAPEKRFLNRRS